MAKCKNCRKLDNILNRGISVGRWCVEKSNSPDIELERSCDKYVPMTNADRIRSMTDEELADFIEMKQFFALARNGTDGEDYTLEWLKSEVGCE